MSNKKIISKWKTFFINKGVKEEVYKHYLVYIDLLTKKNVPIIFDFNHLSKLLGRTNFYLASVINSPNNHYRNFRRNRQNS